MEFGLQETMVYKKLNENKISKIHLHFINKFTILFI